MTTEAALAIVPLFMTLILGILISVERLKGRRHRVNHVLEWIESQQSPKEKDTNG